MGKLRVQQQKFEDAVRGKVRGIDLAIGFERGATA